MMQLDGFNNLDVRPLLGLDPFLRRCAGKNARNIYLTGTNTDPLLYRHHASLTDELRRRGFKPGIRTNGVSDLAPLYLYDEGSLTVCSLDDETSRLMMGGPPPNVRRILQVAPYLKVNVVLGQENRRQIADLLHSLADCGVNRVNLREPYGQPHQGDPLEDNNVPIGSKYGMPLYRLYGMEILYWDVHYVEVESVNLYASGRISETYPITKGCADDGVVEPQSHFLGGRLREQWL